MRNHHYCSIKIKSTGEIFEKALAIDGYFDTDEYGYVTYETKVFRANEVIELPMNTVFIQYIDSPTPIKTYKPKKKIIKKIDLEYPDEINKLVLAEKFNEIIEYLTIISLQKEK